MSKSYKCTVSWIQSGEIYITADSPEEAEKLVKLGHYDDILCEEQVSSFSVDSPVVLDGSEIEDDVI